MQLPIDAIPANNPKLTQPFIKAVQEVFRCMLATEVVIGGPYLKNSLFCTFNVCGVVDFYGPVSGSIVVSFAEQGLDDLIQAFSGAKVPRNGSAFRDAVGELANMIAGSVKGRLGGVTGISTPRVVVGAQLQINAGKNSPSLVVPCQSPYGEFTVEMYILKHQAAA